jgi:molybdopterin synthase catalytic subunit
LRSSPPFREDEGMEKEDTGKVRIQKEDFDVSRELARIKESSSTIGGVVAFVGIVRDFSQGQEVAKLLFEYYPGMAEKKLEELRREAVETFGLRDLYLAHRSGELLPGDNIVLIIAASEHRREAFEAAAWCIARLKERVPIWKKEYTSSGEVWVEGGPGP